MQRAFSCYILLVIWLQFFWWLFTGKSPPKNNHHPISLVRECHWFKHIGQFGFDYFHVSVVACFHLPKSTNSVKMQNNKLSANYKSKSHSWPKSTCYSTDIQPSFSFHQPLYSFLALMLHIIFFGESVKYMNSHSFFFLPSHLKYCLSPPMDWERLSTSSLIDPLIDPLNNLFFFVPSSHHTESPPQRCSLCKKISQTTQQRKM